MNDNEPKAVITAHTLGLIQEFQEVYEEGQIPEVLETVKDLYTSNTEDNKDARAGMIAFLNHLRDLASSIVLSKEKEPAAA